ncbi:MAG: hypothetical protein GY941_14070 [Planctomycetes bacterium]|nr:hypothetical protein [Planctomycetota bacterium]
MVSDSTRGACSKLSREQEKCSQKGSNRVPMEEKELQQLRAADREKFFTALFAGSDDYLEIRAIEPEATNGRKKARSTTEFIELALLANMPRVLEEVAAHEAAHPGWHLYCGVSPRDGRGGTKENVTEYTSVYGDFDYDKRMSKEAILKTLEEFCLKPSMVVDSGGGCQPYWIFETPIQKEHLAEVERIGAWLKDEIKGDSVQDVSRILRIPGSINYKKIYDPKPVCKIISINEHRYILKDFLKRMPEKKEQKAKSARRTIATKTYGNNGARKIIESYLRIVENLMKNNNGNALKVSEIGNPEFFKWANAFVHEFDETGRELFKRLCKCLHMVDSNSLGGGYDERQCDTQYDTCMKRDKTWEGNRANMGGVVTYLKQLIHERRPDIKLKLSDKIELLEEGVTSSPEVDEVMQDLLVVKSSVELSPLIQALSKRIGAKASAINADLKKLNQTMVQDTVLSRYFDSDKQFLRWKLRDTFIEENPCLLVDGTLHFYIDGVFKPQSDEYSYRILAQHLGDHDTHQRVYETLKLIEAETSIDRECLNPHKEIINCRNVMFDTSGEGEELPHGIEFFSTIQINTIYDKDAKCPEWETFCRQVLNPLSLKIGTLSEKEQEAAKEGANAINIMQEFFGLCLIPDVSYETNLILLGKGSNGKSTVLKVLIDLLGAENCSSIPLQNLSDRFAAADLENKLINAFADLPAKALTDSSWLKALTSGDSIKGERKYKPIFSFRNFSRQIYSCNELPRSMDRSEAFYRRWIILPFEVAFSEENRRLNLAENLRKELSINNFPKY